jgi:hypothetical protein
LVIILKVKSVSSVELAEGAGVSISVSFL